MSGLVHSSRNDSPRWHRCNFVRGACCRRASPAARRTYSRAQPVGAVHGRKPRAAGARRPRGVTHVARSSSPTTPCARGHYSRELRCRGIAKRIRSTSSRGRGGGRHCVLLFLFKVAGLYDRDELRARAIDARRGPAACAAHGPVRARSWRSSSRSCSPEASAPTRSRRSGSRPSARSCAGGW